MSNIQSAASKMAKILLKRGSLVQKAIAYQSQLNCMRTAVRFQSSAEARFEGFDTLPTVEPRTARFMSVEAIDKETALRNEEEDIVAARFEDVETLPTMRASTVVNSAASLYDMLKHQHEEDEACMETILERLSLSANGQKIIFPRDQ
jgi:hypothetical protein